MWLSQKWTIGHGNVVIDVVTITAVMFYLAVIAMLSMISLCVIAILL